MPRRIFESYILVRILWLLSIHRSLGWLLCWLETNSFKLLRFRHLLCVCQIRQSKLRFNCAMAAGFLVLVPKVSCSLKLSSWMWPSEGSVRRPSSSAAARHHSPCGMRHSAATHAHNCTTVLARLHRRGTTGGQAVDTPSACRVVRRAQAAHRNAAMRIHRRSVPPTVEAVVASRSAASWP